MASNSNINFYCLGISHHVASPDIRKQFSIEKLKLGEMAKALCHAASFAGVVVVSTCNRTEFFISSSESEVEVFSKAELFIAQHFISDVHFIRRYFVYYSGKNAVRYLFRIAAGLDSLALGEYEILGQIRIAYKEALEKGVTNRILNIIFQQALHYAKQIRCAEEFSNTGLSYGTLVANEIAKLNMVSPKVLLLGGTGQIGNLVLRTLLNREGLKIYATEHRYPLRLSHPCLMMVPYQERYKVLEGCDVVISATSSPHYTVTYQDVNKSCSFAKQRLFIDLSVPSDIDPDIAQFKECKLLNFSYFEDVIKQHQGIREKGSQVAGKRIDDFVDETCRKLCIQDFLLKEEDFNSTVEHLSAREFFYLLQSEASLSELQTLHNLYLRGIKASRIGRFSQEN